MGSACPPHPGRTSRREGTWKVGLLAGSGPDQGGGRDWGQGKLEEGPQEVGWFLGTNVQYNCLMGNVL